jgi:hypothetical protein
MPAEQVADLVFEAIEQEKFYILTHPELKGVIKARLEDLLAEEAPRNPALL